MFNLKFAVSNQFSNMQNPTLSIEYQRFSTLSSSWFKIRDLFEFKLLEFFWNFFHLSVHRKKLFKENKNFNLDPDALLGKPTYIS